ncbi:hypothetical protein BBJ28_00014014 [Nothophytophthora sp. Chile5]|nr:hypothetical protein BBJ28_00014014 [Nothophytophthora sp. Chile5]
MVLSPSSSPVMKVPLGSRVVLSRRRNGSVRYVGKLSNESGEWYGVALDEPKGDNDGTWGKERLFNCVPNHGIFVRRKELYCVKEPPSLQKGPPSPVTDESCSSSSSTSNVSAEQGGDAAGFAAVYPIPIAAEGIASPLARSFKSFRKQLDFISLKTVGVGRTSTETSPGTSPTSKTLMSSPGKPSLKPPSPLRRFASFSQGLPVSKSVSNTENLTIRQAPPPSPPPPKLSPVRRTGSFMAFPVDHSEVREADNIVRTVENTTAPSPGRFSTFRESPINRQSMVDDSNVVMNPAEVGVPLVPGASSADLHLELNGRNEEDAVEPVQVISSLPVDANVDESVVKAVDKPPPSPRPSAINRTSSFRVPALDLSHVVEDSRVDSVACTTLTSSGRWSPEATRCFKGSFAEDKSDDCHVQPVDGHHSPHSPSSLKHLGSFKVPTIVIPNRADEDSRVISTKGTPPSSPGRSGSSKALSIAGIQTLDESSEGCHALVGESTAPSPRDDVSEASSAASAPEPRGTGTWSSRQHQRSPQQEHTAVESLSPSKQNADSDGKRPLFFRRTNVGRSSMERRSSYSSIPSSPSSPPKSPTSGGFALTGNATSRASRATELEKEISAMRSSHENVVAVLRATNKQHAANVLELRAQVAALTEGNLWLERQLTAKGALVRELRELEQEQHRDHVSVGEVEKILELKDAQIQTLEREVAQLRQRLARLEADKDSQLYHQFQHFSACRDRDERRINGLRHEVVAMVSGAAIRFCRVQILEVQGSNSSAFCMRRLLLLFLFVFLQCNERLALQSEMRDLKEMAHSFF